MLLCTVLIRAAKLITSYFNIFYLKLQENFYRNAEVLRFRQLVVSHQNPVVEIRIYRIQGFSGASGAHKIKDSTNP